MIKIDKKSYKSIHIYYVGYITIKNVSDCENVSVSPLYFIVCKADEHLEGKNGNKYLVLDSTDKKIEVLEIHRTLRLKIWLTK